MKKKLELNWKLNLLINMIHEIQRINIKTQANLHLCIEIWPHFILVKCITCWKLRESTLKPTEQNRKILVY